MRRNPDEDLRALERAAAAGDWEATVRLEIERERRGLSPSVLSRLIDEWLTFDSNFAADYFPTPGVLGNRERARQVDALNEIGTQLEGRNFYSWAGSEDGWVTGYTRRGERQWSGRDSFFFSFTDNRDPVRWQFHMRELADEFEARGYKVYFERTDRMFGAFIPLNAARIEVANRIQPEYASLIEADRARQVRGEVGFRNRFWYLGELHRLDESFDYDEAKKTATLEELRELHERETPRQNPDEELRDLERRAKAGDLFAQERLKAERLRRGLIDPRRTADRERRRSGQEARRQARRAAAVSYIRNQESLTAPWRSEPYRQVFVTRPDGAKWTMSIGIGSHTAQIGHYDNEEAAIADALAIISEAGVDHWSHRRALPGQGGYDALEVDRRNPDEDLRAFEHAAAQGDVTALEHLGAERQRRGDLQLAVRVAAIAQALWTSLEAQSEAVFKAAHGSRKRWSVKRLNRERARAFAIDREIDPAMERIRAVWRAAEEAIFAVRRAAPNRILALHEYVSPRTRPLTPQEDFVRNVAYGIKTGDHTSIEIAAQAMAPFVGIGVVVVPAPSSAAHNFGGVMALAQRVAQLVEGRMMPLVQRVRDVASSHQARREGGYTPSILHHVASMSTDDLEDFDLLVNDVAIVDNVVVTGATIEAMRSVLGGPVRAFVWAAEGTAWQHPWSFMRNPDEDLQRG